jgi:hypothetical protein
MLSQVLGIRLWERRKHAAPDPLRDRNWATEPPLSIKRDKKGKTFGETKIFFQDKAPILEAMCHHGHIGWLSLAVLLTKSGKGYNIAR